MTTQTAAGLRASSKPKASAPCRGLHSVSDKIGHWPHAQRIEGARTASSWKQTVFTLRQRPSHRECEASRLSSRITADHVTPAALDVPRPALLSHPRRAACPIHYEPPNCCLPCWVFRGFYRSSKSRQTYSPDKLKTPASVGPASRGQWAIACDWKPSQCLIRGNHSSSVATRLPSCTSAAAESEDIEAKDNHTNGTEPLEQQSGPTSLSCG
jgi:hypothetical protein